MGPSSLSTRPTLRCNGTSLWRVQGKSDREAGHVQFTAVFVHRNMSGTIPVDFLRENGIEFDMAEMEHSNDLIGVAMGADVKAEVFDDELELSTSLLTMSLDKDIPIDEMALSVGDRHLLSKPITDDAMAAFVRVAKQEMCLWHPLGNTTH